MRIRLVVAVATAFAARRAAAVVIGVERVVYEVGQVVLVVME